MQIVRTTLYIRRMAELVDDKTRDRIELRIAAVADTAPVMKGGGGARKVRFQLPGKGKSGGGRVICFVRTSHDQLILLTAYAKAEQETLSPEQTKAIRALIAQIKGD